MDMAILQSLGIHKGKMVKRKNTSNENNEIQIQAKLFFMNYIYFI